ncbi:MAG: TasA family protein [Actinomycetes bacterium]
MSRHAYPTAVRSRRARRTAGAAAFMLLGLAVTGAGVYAALNATAFNTSPQNVTSGTVKLSLSATAPSAGFTSAITNMAPGDVVNRYIDLTNNGTLATQALTLSAVDATGTKLTSDATNGLHVTVTSCPIPWVQVGAGTCVGGTTLLNNVPVSSLISSPSTLVAGTVAASYALQFSITLPDQTETTTNGTLPANTIQGLSASMTWTFGESQRTATNTSS